MNDDLIDTKPAVDDDPAAKIVEQWIKLREAQGFTREAAIAELNAARLAMVNLARD
jgi:hypothetical protein